MWHLSNQTTVPKDSVTYEGRDYYTYEYLKIEMSKSTKFSRFDCFIHQRFSIIFSMFR